MAANELIEWITQIKLEEFLVGVFLATHRNSFSA